MKKSIDTLVGQVIKIKETHKKQVNETKENHGEKSWQRFFIHQSKYAATQGHQLSKVTKLR